MNDTHGHPPERDDTSNIYAVVPRSVLTDTSLSASARLLYALLDSRQTSASRVRVTRQLLAADLGVSARHVGELLAELRTAGWLLTGRTGRSSSYKLVNPARLKLMNRTAEQLLDNVAAEPSTRTNTTNTEQLADTATTDALSALLSADRRAAVYLGTRANRTALAAAERRGWTLQQIAEQLNSVNLGTATRPGAVLSTRLAQIATSRTPDETRQERHQQHQQEQQRQELVRSGALACQHGEPRGAEACALCRRAAADTAVSIAAALEPTGDPADMRARDALADLVVAADPTADEQLHALVAEFADGFRIDRSATA